MKTKCELKVYICVHMFKPVSCWTDWSKSCTKSCPLHLFLSAFDFCKPCYYTHISLESTVKTLKQTMTGVGLQQVSLEQQPSHGKHVEKYLFKVINEDITILFLLSGCFSIA